MPIWVALSFAASAANHRSISKARMKPASKDSPIPKYSNWRQPRGRILVSHDISTMPVDFAARLHLGLKSPGVLLAFQRSDVRDVIESLVFIWAASCEEEWAGQIHYLPSLSRHVFH